MNNLRAVALGLFVAVLSIGVSVASLSFFIASMSALQIAAWIVSLILAFLFGLTIWRITAIRHADPPVIMGESREVPLALPAPKFYRTSQNSWARSDRIDSEAQRVAQLLRDHDAPPTRDAIQAHAGILGHEQARVIVSRWKLWGWVDDPGQGVAPKWIDGDDE